MIGQPRLQDRPDGSLCRLTDRSWGGWLRGYYLTVFPTPEGWHVHVRHPAGHCVRCLPVASVAEGGRQGRRVVEEDIGALTGPNSRGMIQP